MEERVYTTQIDLSLNHAVGRSNNSGLASIVNVHTKMAVTVVCIFCIVSIPWCKPRKYGLRAIRRSINKTKNSGLFNIDLVLVDIGADGIAL